MPRTVSLQLPPDASPGDALTFVVDGKELEIPVPEGSQPGDILQIQIEDSEGKENCDKHEDEIEIELANGSTLRFSTAGSASGNHKSGEEVSNSIGVDDGTYAHPWPAGLAMSQFCGTPEFKDLLKSLFTDLDTKGGSKCHDPLNVLEFGSGLGLVGLSFAAQYPQLKDFGLPPSIRVVLTDVPEGGMALLQQNVERNKSLLQQQSVETVPLLWNVEPPKSTAEELAGKHFHLLLASDVLYNHETIPALVATFKRYLTDSSSLIVAVRWRKPDLERSFFEALEGWQGKQWHLVHTLHSPLSWKEYGNPSFEASNRYFHQTLISVLGKPHSLADILKQDDTNGESGRPLQEQMTDSEADAFENCHIQIYCLSKHKVGSISDSSQEKESRKRQREN